MSGSADRSDEEEHPVERVEPAPERIAKGQHDLHHRPHFEQAGGAELLVETRREPERGGLVSRRLQQGVWDGEHGRVAAKQCRRLALDLDHAGPPADPPRNRAHQDLTSAGESTGENLGHSADTGRRAKARGVGRLVGLDLRQPGGAQARGIGGMEAFDVAEEMGPDLEIVRCSTARVQRHDERSIRAVDPRRTPDEPGNEARETRQVLPVVVRPPELQAVCLRHADAGPGEQIVHLPLSPDPLGAELQGRARRPSGGPHPAAEAVARLHQRHRRTRLDQPPCRRETGEAGADYDDMHETTFAGLIGEQVCVLGVALKPVSDVPAGGNDPESFTAGVADRRFNQEGGIASPAVGARHISAEQVEHARDDGRIRQHGGAGGDAERKAMRLGVVLDVHWREASPFPAVRPPS